MKRLHPGEYQAMTPEQQAEHRRELRNRWLRKAGNKARVREWNKKYLKLYWEERKDLPVVKVCSKCGKTVVLTARRTVCDKCKAIPSKTKLLQIERDKKAVQRFKRIEAVIKLAKETTLTQRQIAEQTGTHQPVVSKIIIEYSIKRPKK